jgi:uncharacterized protein YjbI with pentapeptide repeats
VPPVRLVPTSIEAWQLPSIEAIQKVGSGWATLHELLVAGEVDYVTQKPESLWSNRLVLPNFEIGNRSKLDAEGKIALSPEAVSLRGRRLEAAVFVDAHLRKGDFTGAQLARANFLRADLREAKFGCDWAGKNRKCAQLQGASLDFAQLQGASLDFAQLQGASLDFAQLQGASLDFAQLQGASLDVAQLQGASLDRAQLQGASLNRTQLQGSSLEDAQLQGASLEFAQLQGASLNNAQLQGASLIGVELSGASLNSAQLQGALLATARLQGASLDLAQLQGASLWSAQLQDASLDHVFVWRTKAPTKDQAKGALINEPRPEPKYFSLRCGVDESCDWDDQAYADLKELIEAVPKGSARDTALMRIEPLGKKPYEEDAVSAKDWRDFAAESQRSVETYPGALATLLITIGCSANGAPYVIGGLIPASGDAQMW